MSRVEEELLGLGRKIGRKLGSDRNKAQDGGLGETPERTSRARRTLGPTLPVSPRTITQPARG